MFRQGKVQHRLKRVVGLPPHHAHLLLVHPCLLKIAPFHKDEEGGNENEQRQEDISHYHLDVQVRRTLVFFILLLSHC